MHDDDETRFPRISLWTFLRGVFGPILRFATLDLSGLLGRRKREG